jgi:hypothetical protein
MNRPQEQTLERWAQEHGRVHVREGYADGHIELTVYGGKSWKVNEQGVPSEQAPDFSVDWGYKERPPRRPPPITRNLAKELTDGSV